MGRRPLFVAAVVLVCAAGALGHVRLLHDTLGTPLRWSNPGNVGIVINSAGSDDLPDGSHEAALRLAIEKWNAVPGSFATLVEDRSPGSQGRTDWGSPDIHLILFDENNSSGYCSPGTVALTIYKYDNGGTFSDADILFNGRDYRFTTSGQAGRFDVQDVGTHEIGHLLGLDHSGWAGATMYPYVDTQMVLHRSLSSDEVHGLRAAYPLAGFARITGDVGRSSDGMPVAGAHVVARDAQGRTATSVLAASDGSYALSGLDPGTYTVYAVPLHTPVGVGNLGPGNVIRTDFATTAYSAPVSVGTGTVPIGTLSVPPSVGLSLGRAGDRFPLHVVAGASATFTVRGTSLSAPGAITASDPDVVLDRVTFGGSSVTFRTQVPAGEEPGHVDLTVTNKYGEVCTLPAAIEITPPPPSVSSVDPGLGPQAGGTFVTIRGAGFSPGSHVVLGDQVYTDGIAGTTVVDPTTITLTTAPTAPGTHDAVVIDPTGVEGRVADAFVVEPAPIVSQPPSGEGGGSCAMRPAGPPPGPRSALLGAWWLALVLLVLGERARRARPAPRRIRA